MSQPPGGQWGPRQGQYPPPQGYPPPQPGHPPAPYPPARPQGTNGLAIAALVLSLLGISLLGVVFGFVALSQIKRTGQGGRGLAIAGLIISAVSMVIFVIVVIAVIAAAPVRSEAGGVTSGGSVSSTSLQVGDCVATFDVGPQVTDLPLVPCTQPHESEVFAVFDAVEGPFPATTGVETWSNDCADRLPGYSPSAPDDPAIKLNIVRPTAETWATGDREVVCLATAVEGTTTSSIRGR